MRLLDRKPLLDLSSPANMQKILELHPDAERPSPLLTCRVLRLL
jgi:hypothetical protein